MLTISAVETRSEGKFLFHQSLFLECQEAGDRHLAQAQDLCLPDSDEDFDMSAAQIQSLDSFFGGLQAVLEVSRQGTNFRAAIERA